MFLVGEGKGDIGGLAFPPAFQTTRPGFAQPIVRRLASTRVRISGQKISNLPRRRIRAVRDIVQRRAYLAARIAQSEDADVVIFLHDVDTATGKSGQAAAERHMDRMRAAVENGFAQAGTGLRCVAGTPLRTVEAWALGDMRAVARASGRKQPASLPKPPEELWGPARDPSSNHPKHVLHRQFEHQPGHEDYATIAEHADLDVLSRNCPKSFAPFADGLRDALR